MKFVLKKLVRLYQFTLSPYLGGQCRYYPTCSNYALQALECHPWPKAVVMIIWRILRCNPFSQGGKDLPCPHHHTHSTSSQHEVSNGN